MTICVWYSHFCIVAPILLAGRSTALFLDLTQDLRGGDSQWQGTVRKMPVSTFIDEPTDSNVGDLMFHYQVQYMLADSRCHSGADRAGTVAYSPVLPLALTGDQWIHRVDREAALLKDSVVP